MKNTLFVVAMIATTLFLTACEKITGEAASPPTITAQGFHIDTVLEGKVGQFGSVRLRIECPAGIHKLQITERSYDIDLASTPERDHFQFFDLDSRVLLSKDVTLDFQNYINQKLNQPGDYTFNVAVTDKDDRVVHTNINVRLQETEMQTEPAQSKLPSSEIQQTRPESAPVKTGRFEITRIGPREIEGDETFGLAWKTVDEIQVTIRVRKHESGASKLSQFSSAEYDNVVTEDNLGNLLAYAEDRDAIVFDTANNAAAGKVLGVVNSGKPYLLKSHQSTTVLSEVGTTVTISGEYKY